MGGHEGGLEDRMDGPTDHGPVAESDRRTLLAAADVVRSRADPRCAVCGSAGDFLLSEPPRVQRVVCWEHVSPVAARFRRDGPANRPIAVPLSAEFARSRGFPPPTRSPGTDKQAIRERVWDAIEAAGIGRFPVPPRGRIPTVAGADDATTRLAHRDEWRAAETVMGNSDAPQLPVRRRALHAGMALFVRVPRLRDPEPFVRLDPAEIEDRDAAPTVSHLAEYGTRIGPDAMPRIDLIVAGSVAVTPWGDRVGDGEGECDLAFAVLAEAGLLDRDTTVATTVHERQVIEDPIETAPLDVPMDLVVTPERVIETDRRDDRPDGLDWSALAEATIDERPILERLAPDRRWGRDDG